LGSHILVAARKAFRGSLPREAHLDWVWSRHWLDFLGRCPMRSRYSTPPLFGRRQCSSCPLKAVCGALEHQSSVRVMFGEYRLPLADTGLSTCTGSHSKSQPSLSGVHPFPRVSYASGSLARSYGARLLDCLTSSLRLAPVQVLVACVALRTLLTTDDALDKFLRLACSNTTRPRQF